MNTQVAHFPERTLLEVRGDDRVNFLQALITNDVEGLAKGIGCFAGLLSPQGKILFDFFVIDTGETLVLDCPRANGADLLKRLTFYRLRAKVTIEDATARWSTGAAWGDGAEDWAQQNAAVAFNDPRLSEMGFRLLLDQSQTPSSSAGFEEYERMRIALAVPEGGKDYAYGDTFPHEACFDLLHGVDFKKGCYVGQEVVSRMQHRGTARTRVVAVSAPHPLPTGGADILADGFAVGHLGSVAGNQGIALARLDRIKAALSKGQTLTVGEVPVEIAAPAWASYSVDGVAAEAAH